MLNCTQFWFSMDFFFPVDCLQSCTLSHVEGDTHIIYLSYALTPNIYFLTQWERMTKCGCCIAKRGDWQPRCKQHRMIVQQQSVESEETSTLNDSGPRVIRASCPEPVDKEPVWLHNALSFTKLNCLKCMYNMWGTHTLVFNFPC